MDIVFHGYKLSEWFDMKTGLKIPGNKIYRQNKPIYSNLCASLNLSTEGTKDILLMSLQAYVFTQEQLDEMKAFNKARREAREAVIRKANFEKRLKELEDSPKPHDYYTTTLLEFHRNQNEIIIVIQ